ncbi:alcohol dehydrogenase [Agrilactobacillus composti DSM 18527 = JCM 14202]|nr:alcohol dehydrogenase [Agrilactobacillus composti DSM 18527 = JCM 14202]
MKITAAVVEKQGDPFVIKDDIELAPMGPDDVQVTWSLLESVTPMKLYELAML